MDLLKYFLLLTLVNIAPFQSTIADFLVFKFSRSGKKIGTLKLQRSLGGEYGARTRDLLTASQTRSQLR